MYDLHLWGAEQPGTVCAQGHPTAEPTSEASQGRGLPQHFGILSPWGKKKKKKRNEQTKHRREPICARDALQFLEWGKRNAGQVNPRDENPLGSNASGSRPRCQAPRGCTPPRSGMCGTLWKAAAGPVAGRARGGGQPWGRVRSAAGGQVPALGQSERLELCSASAGFAPCRFNRLLDTSGLCWSQFHSFNYFNSS